MEGSAPALWMPVRDVDMPKTFLPSRQKQFIGVLDGLLAYCAVTNRQFECLYFPAARFECDIVRRYRWEFLAAAIFLPFMAVPLGLVLVFFAALVLPDPGLIVFSGLYGVSAAGFLVYALVRFGMRGTQVVLSAQIADGPLTLRLWCRRREGHALCGHLATARETGPAGNAATVPFGWHHDWSSAAPLWRAVGSALLMFAAVWAVLNAVGFYLLPAGSPDPGHDPVSRAILGLSATAGLGAFSAVYLRAPSRRGAHVAAMRAFLEGDWTAAYTHLTALLESPEGVSYGVPMLKAHIEAVWGRHDDVRRTGLWLMQYDEDAGQSIRQTADDWEQWRRALDEGAE